jgi:hypothetical protein
MLVAAGALAINMFRRFHMAGSCCYNSSEEVR